MPHTKFPWLDVTVSELEALNRGEDITKSIPESWGVNPGDRLELDIDHKFCGIAVVVGQGTRSGQSIPYIIRKVG